MLDVHPYRREELPSGIGPEAALAAELASVPSVRHVLAERAAGSLLVWISIENPSKGTLESVFNKELALMDGFPEVNFDFNVISAKNGDRLASAPDAKVIFSREGL